MGTEKKVTWRYVTSGSCLMILSQDTQLHVVIWWWLLPKGVSGISFSIIMELKMTLITAALNIVFGYLCSTISFHYIMPCLVFRFLVPLFGYSNRVWLWISELILQLRARPRSSEAQTASIVSICMPWWWSHQQLHASLSSADHAGVHQVRTCC